jgi:hypothetical protein
MIVSTIMQAGLSQSKRWRVVNRNSDERLGRRLSFTRVFTKKQLAVQAQHRRGVEAHFDDFEKDCHFDSCTYGCVPPYNQTPQAAFI